MISASSMITIKFNELGRAQFLLKNTSDKKHYKK